MKLRREKNPLLKKGLIVFMLFFFFFTLSFTPFPGKLKNGFLLVSSSLQSLLFQKGNGLYEVTRIIFRTSEMREEINRLRSDNRSLYARLSLQREILSENRALRALLDMEWDEEEFIFSEVIGVMFEEGQILVRQGEKLGVKEGYPVITPEGVLVGSVIEVHKDFSRVMLITSDSSSFEAKIQGDNEYVGVLRGDNGGLLLDTVPKDANFKKGDMVTSFPQGGLHPRGLFIGKVSEIIDNDVEAFLQARVDPAFKLHDLRFLFILKR